MSYTPKRVQRKRSAGWRTPLCGCGCGRKAIYVGRPTIWGNPYRIVRDAYDLWRIIRDGETLAIVRSAQDAHTIAVVLYREHASSAAIRLRALHTLAGHDLMDWCPLDQPCHVDVLLELADCPRVIGAER